MCQIHHEAGVGWSGPGNCQVGARGLLGVIPSLLLFARSGGGVLGGGVAFTEAVDCFRKRTEGVLDLLEFQGLW